MAPRNHVAKLLTSAEQGRYQEHGIVFPIRVLASDEADHYRRACDDLERQLGGRPRTVEVRQMHLHLRWAYQLATHPRVLDAVEDVLGPDLLVWATELFAKHPHDGAVSIGWHRDRTYMEFDPSLTVTAWIALSRCTAENGCLRAVLELQRRAAAGWDVRSGRSSERSENRLPDVPDEAIQEVALRAGEMSLHDVHILHGSGPNRSAEKRVGFAIRYITPAAVPRADRPPAVLARGQDRYNHFQLADPPPEVATESTLGELKRSALKHLEATLQNVKHATR
jgi:ectoine hydroxylase-related dioxygenase (phytanoyl-CoA dioxygenase family)